MKFMMKNMRRVFIIAALCILSATSAFAQKRDRDALKRAFDRERFVEAKSMAEKLYAKHPDNSEYNYWYAACCIETGEIPDSQISQTIFGHESAVGQRL